MVLSLQWHETKSSREAKQFLQIIFSDVLHEEPGVRKTLIFSLAVKLETTRRTVADKMPAS